MRSTVQSQHFEISICIWTKTVWDKVMNRPL